MEKKKKRKKEKKEKNISLGRNQESICGLSDCHNMIGILVKGKALMYQTKNYSIEVSKILTKRILITIFQKFHFMHHVYSRTQMIFTGLTRL